MKTVTMTELRKNLFRLVDEAIATGEPVVLDRKGVRVTIQGEGKFGHETRTEQEERWRKFWAQPPRPGWPDFTVEEFNRWSAEAWEWDPDTKFKL